jgi:hypothetical protein
MKITEQQLQQIIEEEVQKGIEEGWLDRQRARFSPSDIAKGVASRFGKAGSQIKSMSAAPEQQAARIIRMHQKKILSNLQKLGSLGEDFIGDIVKLGLGEDPVMRQLAKQLKTIEPFAQGQLRNFSQLDAWADSLESGSRVAASPSSWEVESGEAEEEEKAPAPQRKASSLSDPEFWKGGIRERLLREIEAAIQRKLSEGK